MPWKKNKILFLHYSLQPTRLHNSKVLFSVETGADDTNFDPFLELTGSLLWPRIPYDHKPYTALSVKIKILAKQTGFISLEIARNDFVLSTLLTFTSELINFYLNLSFLIFVF